MPYGEDSISHKALFFWEKRKGEDKVVVAPPPKSLVVGSLIQEMGNLCVIGPRRFKPTPASPKV